MTFFLTIWQGNALHCAVIGLQIVERNPRIKAGEKLRRFAASMPPNRPPDMSPEEWREYLRRFPRMAWWLRQVDGDHPDPPGMPQSSQSTARFSPPSWAPSPPR